MNNETSHTHTLTFSLRDWRQGSELLEALGHNESQNLTESHDLTLDHCETEELENELSLTELEWTLENAEC